MNVHCQWMKALHTHVNPQVTLVARDQQRATNVPLNDNRAIINQVLNILKDEDPSASGEIHRLNYPVDRCSSGQTKSVVLSQEAGVVIGEDESGGTEVIES